MITLDKLTTMGGFPSPELVKKSGAFGEYTFDFFVKKIRVRDARAITAAEDGVHEADILMVAACIRLGEDGSESMTYEQAGDLDPLLFKVFSDAVNEVYAKKP